MFILGITGGIGCGKSTVAEILKKHGLNVLDADEISHQVTKAGGRAMDAIIEEFGVEYVADDGSLNRPKMAQKVFTDARSLDKLSLIIHQQVFAEIDYRIEKLKKASEKIVVLDVPVPAKNGFVDRCDQIWVVWAADSVRINRLEERGMPADESRRRMAMQLSKQEYLELGDKLIENNGEVRELEGKINELLKQELISRGIPVYLGYQYADSREETSLELANLEGSESDEDNLDIETE